MHVMTDWIHVVRLEGMMGDWDWRDFIPKLMNTDRLSVWC